jgi:hypothetical protein
MSDREILERCLRSCDYRCCEVRCPHQKTAANITAAKWPLGHNQWTQWKIVDCPLLPAGEVWCDMTCLSQLESRGRELPLPTELSPES